MDTYVGRCGIANIA